MASVTQLGSWKGLLDRLGLAQDDATFDALVAAYSGPDRAYHSLDHITHCLEELESTHLPAGRSDPIALAIWFHDAVYDWRSSTNEADSAGWADTFLGTVGAKSELAASVRELIMATCHHFDAELLGDQSLIADIDLSILGDAPDRFEKYEVGIRFEYRAVPEPIYRTKRAEVLRSFLQRPRIFATDAFHSAYESRARENLAKAIDRLTTDETTR